MLNKPLRNRVVIITRPRKVSGGAAAALATRGARVIFAPLIQVVPPRSYNALDRALLNLRRYDAVAFTSANSVDFFFLRCRKLLGRVPASPRILAAVGSATAKAVARHGWRCSVVPEDARAAGLARVLRVPRGSRVLIPRAERGLDTLPIALRKNGAHVTVVPAYRTISDLQGRRSLRRALALGADLAARDLALSNAAAVAIGPTTAAALRSLGITPAAVSKKPDPESFARAVVLALKGRPL
jgi:uroporphyrinogen-III synthase